MNIQMVSRTLPISDSPETEKRKNIIHIHTSLRQADENIILLQK